MNSNLTAGAFFLTLVLGSTSLAQSNDPRGDSDSAAATTPAAEDPMIAAAHERYHAEHWEQGARRPGFDLGQLTLTDLIGSELEYDAGAGQVVRRYADDQGTPSLMVELHVRNTVAEAQAELLADIAFVQSVKELPRTAARGIAAGDVGFIGFAGTLQDRIAWIAFVEGNLEFRVMVLDPSADRQPDVRGAAERISQQARAMTELKNGAELPRPQFVRAAAADLRCFEGQDVPILVETSGASDSNHLVFEVAGPGRGYVERDARGLPRLHATRAGAIQVTVHAWSALGTHVTEQIPLEIIAGS